MSKLERAEQIVSAQRRKVRETVQGLREKGHGVAGYRNGFPQTWRDYRGAFAYLLDVRSGVMSVSLKERPKVKRKPINDKEREDIISDARLAVEQGFATDDQYALAFRGARTW